MTSYYEYDPQDAEDDDLQRMLEGRDVDEDLDFVEPISRKDDKTKSKPSKAGPKSSKTGDGSKKKESKSKKPAVTGDDDDMDGFIERDGDEDLDNFIENDYEEDDDAPPGPDEAIEDNTPEAGEGKASVPRVIRAKRVVKNPRPKLDTNLLKTSNGLLQLREVQKSLVLKGKGYEKEDLGKILFGIEHWAHRLFPQYNFDDFLEKTEKLGSKKEISNYLKKMRLGMPLECTDDRNDDEVGDEEVVVDDDVLGEPMERLTAEEAFDNLFEQDTGRVQEKLPATESAPLTEDQLQIIADKRLQAIARREKAQEARQNVTTIELAVEPVEEVNHEPSVTDNGDEQMFDEDDIIKKLNAPADTDDSDNDEENVDSGKTLSPSPKRQVSKSPQTRKQSSDDDDDSGSEIGNQQPRGRLRIVEDDDD